MASLAAIIQIPIDLRLYGTRSPLSVLPWLVAVVVVAALYAVSRTAAGRVNAPQGSSWHYSAARAVIVTFILASHAAAGIAVAAHGASARVVTGLHLLRIVGVSFVSICASHWGQSFAT